MSDEPRESQDAPEEQAARYEAPEAEEVPTDKSAETPTGAFTGVDNSDRNLKTGFAEVDVDAVLAAVRALPVTIHHQPRR